MVRVPAQHVCSAVGNKWHDTCTDALRTGVEHSRLGLSKTRAKQASPGCGPWVTGTVLPEHVMTQEQAVQPMHDGDMGTFYVLATSAPVATQEDEVTARSLEGEAMRSGADIVMIDEASELASQDAQPPEEPCTGAPGQHTPPLPPTRVESIGSPEVRSPCAGVGGAENDGMEGPRGAPAAMSPMSPTRRDANGEEQQEQQGLGIGGAGLAVGEELPQENRGPPLPPSLIRTLMTNVATTVDCTLCNRACNRSRRTHETLTYTVLIFSYSIVHFRQPPTVLQLRLPS